MPIPLRPNTETPGAFPGFRQDGISGDGQAGPVSIRVRSAIVALKLPTATQLADVLQDAPLSPLLLVPSLGLAMRDQLVPFQLSIKVCSTPDPFW